MEKAKEIEMFEISEKQEPVGTEIFDPTMPSTLDFDEDNQHEKSFINPEKKLPEMGKTLLIGSEMKAFRVLGVSSAPSEPHLRPGSLVPFAPNAHPVRIENLRSGGLKRLWQSVVGYSKRLALVQQGFLYLLQQRGDSLYVDSVMPLRSLFKVFVDPEQEQLRLVVRSEARLTNLDLRPENFILLLGLLNHELNLCGQALSE